MKKELLTKNIFNRYKHSVAEMWSNLFFYVCVYLACFMLLFSICYTSSYVYGDSMKPTINNYANYEKNRDIVYIDRLAEYTYGDIIVIKKPTMQIIKRVIALPGDSINIEYRDGKYYTVRNGIPLDEDEFIRITGDSDYNGMQHAYESFKDYKRENQYNNDVMFTDRDNPETSAIIVGDNQVFVLGDNRSNSEDSTEEGCFEMSKVVGKVQILVKVNQNPLFELLKYFFWPF